ncbi:MAG: hypothetical protein U1E86_00630 [Burkholderiaceae bacterium]
MAISPADQASSSSTSDQSPAAPSPIVDMGSPSKPTTPTQPIVPEVPAQAQLLAASVVETPVLSTSAVGNFTWLQNGYAIDGASAATYTLPSVRCDDAATVFKVMARGAGGTTPGPSIVLAPTGCTTTLIAGTTTPSFSRDGAGRDAHFVKPYGITPKPGGGMYVAAGALRLVDATGKVTTVPGETFGWVYASTTDAAGNVYTVEGMAICKLTPSGTKTIVAGSSGPVDSPGSDSRPLDQWQIDAVGAAARFQAPRGIAVDAAGTLFVTDQTTVRRIAPDGTVTTIAGRVLEQGSVDGRGADARFSALRGIAVDRAGALYVADEVGTIRRVGAGGVVTTLAGVAGQRGLVDGQGAAARFNMPEGLVLEPSGSLLVADGANDRVRRVSPAGVVTTLPFIASAPAQLDGPFMFDWPVFVWGIALDATGSIWLTAPNDDAVLRVVDGARTVVPVGRTPEPVGLADAYGAQARLGDVARITVAPDGTIWLADSGTIRSVDRFSRVRTVAGSPAGVGSFADGVGAAASFAQLSSVVTDAAGNLYATDGGALRRIAADGTVTTVVGYPSKFDPTNMQRLDPEIWSGGVAVLDADGTWFVGKGCELSRVDPDGSVRHLSGGWDFCNQMNEPTPIRRLALAPDGTLLVLTGNLLSRFSKAGIPLQRTSIQGYALAVDSRNNAYVSVSDGRAIRKVAAGGDVSTLPYRIYTPAPSDLTDDRWLCSNRVRDIAIAPDDSLVVACDRALIRVALPADTTTSVP